jgi:uncharacterized alpha/beta hydrolase family protein
MTTEFKIFILIIIIAIVLLFIYLKKISKQLNTPATKIQVIQDNSDKNLYPTFVEGTGEQQFRINNPSLNYNPSKNILSSDKFKGDLIGNADSSTKTNKVVISEI